MQKLISQYGMRVGRTVMITIATGLGVCSILFARLLRA